jgi:hypothetical protein
VLGFRVVVLLLKLSFLCTRERFERLHKPGHLRRVHVLAERLQDMHDANRTAARRRSIQYPFIGLPRACRGRLRSC